MRARLNRFLAALGTAGVLGTGLLAACAGFWISALQPAYEELTAQRLAVERMRARTPYRPVGASGPAEELRRFYRLFPPANALTAEVERLHRLGRKAGLELEQGEYRLERRAGGLWAYRITLPVRGTYVQTRDFIGAVLREMPIASLETVRFERKRALDAELDTQLRLTLHVRPSGEMP